MESNGILLIKKEHAKGEDGYRTFSIRIKETTAAALDGISEKSNRSRNELINIFLEYGVGHYEIIE